MKINKGSQILFFLILSYSKYIKLASLSHQLTLFKGLNSSHKKVKGFSMEMFREKNDMIISIASEKAFNKFNIHSWFSKMPLENQKWITFLIKRIQ